MRNPPPLTPRQRFPRGLKQPEQGFRFGADTLLLGAFARSQAAKAAAGAGPARGLEIGVGCGAASFALQLRQTGAVPHITGIDIEVEMVEAARVNAKLLGLDGCFQAELCAASEHAASRPYDFALANPPFREPGTGRVCVQERAWARFEGAGGLAEFTACAARNLRQRGRFFLLHLAERLAGVLRALEDAELAPKRVLPVQGHTGQAPRLVLVEAVRGAGTGLALEAPLTLYDEGGSLTPQALEFCPYLGANPRRCTAQHAEPLANQDIQG